MSETVQRVSSAIGVIGRSGAGKTTLLVTAAEYLWETHQRVLMLASADGGAIPTMVQRRIRQGLIRFWRMRTRSAVGLGLETMSLASKGYWPQSIDPITGETAPAVPLVKPISERYSLSCAKGHPLGVVTAAGLLKPTPCRECKRIVGTEELVVEQTVARTRGFETVGDYAFDSATAWSNWVLDEMDAMRGGGHIGGEKSSFGGVVVSGTYKAGGNNRADYGFAQSRLYQFVHNSIAIPHLVEGPIWTGLTLETTDEYGLPVVGMKLAGAAKTDECGAWFGSVVEIGETLNESGQACVTLFLRPYTDERGRYHLLKTSGSPWGVPDRLVDPPRTEKRPFVGASLGIYLRMLDTDVREQVGTEAGIAVPSNYGEEAVVTASAEPAPAAPVPAAPAAPVARPVVGQPTGRPGVPRPATLPQSASAAAGNGLSPATPTAAGPRAVPAPPGRRPPARAPGV